MTQNNTSKKTYLIDLSVLLSIGKRALFAFEGENIVIPLPAVKELERKRDDLLLGYTARTVLKALEKLRAQDNDQFSTGGIVKDENGGLLRIEMNHIDQSSMPDSLKNDKSVDNLILAIANNLNKEENIVLVSNNLTMRIIAQASLNIKAVEFINPSFQGDYTGVVTATTSSDNINSLYQNEEFSVRHISSDVSKLGANVGVILKSDSEKSKSGLALVSDGMVRRLNEVNAFDIKGKNTEQRFALNYLLNPDLPIVSLGGPAGTGKTLLALAAGLEQILERQTYKKIIIFRPVTAVGDQELGFLPGTEAEKMQPWAGAIYDAIESISSRGGEILKTVQESAKLEILPVTHIRGRNLRDSFIIIDEAQNLDRNTLLSVLARVAENSKAVFSWDAAQKDNTNLGRHDGIVAVVDSLRKEKEFAHVTLRKSERSRVAEMASQLLENE